MVKQTRLETTRLIFQCFLVAPRNRHDDTVEIRHLKRSLLSTKPNCLRHFVPGDAVQSLFQNVRSADVHKYFLI